MYNRVRNFKISKFFVLISKIKWKQQEKTKIWIFNDDFVYVLQKGLNEYLERFSKSGIPIYNSKVQDMAGRNTRTKRRKGNRTQTIVKCYALHANAIMSTVVRHWEKAHDLTMTQKGTLIGQTPPKTKTSCILWTWYTTMLQVLLILVVFSYSRRIIFPLSK